MSHPHSHAHTHVAVDFSLVSHEEGLRVVQISCALLVLTALIQAAILTISNSVALLADTIHNFGDAATAVPLGIAFFFARLKPDRRFTYGYGRVEDLAGIVVVLLILFSAVMAGYESVRRFFHPETVSHLGAVAAASVVSFLGNEVAAVLRIRVGKKIGSAALVADGYHARIDGLASLAVLLGAFGVWLGFPLADPLIGLLITATLFYIVWEAGGTILVRMLDGVDPAVIDDIRHAIDHVEGVKNVGEVRARWIGHKLYADIDISVRKEANISEGHEIAKEVSHQVLHHLPQLGKATIHVDPEDKLGEEHHRHTHENCR